MLGPQHVILTTSVSNLSFYNIWIPSDNFTLCLINNSFFLIENTIMSSCSVKQKIK